MSEERHPAERTPEAGRAEMRAGGADARRAPRAARQLDAFAGRDVRGVARQLDLFDELGAARPVLSQNATRSAG